MPAVLSSGIVEKEARRVLKDVFGYADYRPHQEDIIAAVLSGRDVLAIMPTGGGKSLCYQIPALILPGTSLVVSPLISLMRDQVGFLRGLGVDARFLNSSLEADEYAAVAAEARSGALKLLYAAPETALKPSFLSLLGPAGPSLIAIDEAHCVSEWGHDFRPEYRRLAELREAFPASPFLAFTATATPQVGGDIESCLGLRSPARVVASFDRPNIALEVVPKFDALEQIDEYLRLAEGSGIIYCLSRKRADELSAALAARGHSVGTYHAGMEDARRSEQQDRFINDQIRVMVATVAFGMGIDKPDIRFVLHADLPKSLEGYYQEIGRAGRDGLPARARLLYSYGDVRRLEFTLEGKEGSALAAARSQIKAMVRYAEAPTCRRAALLAYFGEDYGRGSCASCDVCLGQGSLADITEDAHKLLSAVARTGERYGASYVIDVLRGEATEKVEERGHSSLSVFGLGRGVAKQEWMAFTRQLAALGYLETDPEYGTLSLSTKSWQAFKDRLPILGRPLSQPAQGLSSRKRRSSRPRAPTSAYPETGWKASTSAELEGINPSLVETLRGLRTRLARERGVPPYIIFSDRTMYDLALKRPRDENSLLDVFGMGRKKAAMLGPEILEALRRSREA
jgi:ATP-dependent DNA helicase RecQ